MAVQRMCKDCGRSIIVYSTLQNRCPACQKKRQKPKQYKPLVQKKPLTPKSQKQRLYDVWRDTVARPYLDTRFGRQCHYCGLLPPKDMETGQYGYHDVHHKQTRGSKAELKMDVHNVVYACRNCHSKLTDGKM